MTETNFEIELRKRGKRRLIGAIILTLASLAALPFLIKKPSSDIDRGLIVNIIDPEVPKNAFDIKPLEENKNINAFPDLLGKDLSIPNQEVKKIFLQSHTLPNNKKLQEIYKNLDQKKISYQKSEITSGGKTRITLTFGPYDINYLEKYLSIVQPIVGEIKLIEQ